MGNECDQCEAVTQGCKRQQFRTELKNREKLDLSRGENNDKSQSKLQAISNLRKNAGIEADKNYSNQTNPHQQSSVEIIKNHRPPDEPSPQSKTNLKFLQQNSEKNNEKIKFLERQSYNQSKISADEINFIKLPIESGYDRKNNLKLEQLQRNLLLSRQPSKFMNQKDKKKSEQSLKNIRNSTIKIQDSIIHQSRFQDMDKQNSLFKKGQIVLITESKWNKRNIQKIDKQGQNILDSNNRSKALKDFNNALNQSPINFVNRQQNAPLNHNDSGINIDQQSFVQQIHQVQQQTFYIRPGVYFDGFISKINKKLQNQGAITFQKDKTELIINFQNGNLNLQKNAVLNFADGSAFQGQLKAQNQRDDYAVSGQGKFVFPDGSYYVGQWLKNLPHGKGKHKFSDGSSYEGDFIEGRKQGQGKLVVQNSLIYVGSFLNNRMQGQGQMYLIDSNSGKQRIKRIYKGYFKNGKLQGENCEVSYVDEQTKYIGGFYDGKKSGYGQYYYDDGRIWQGEWKDNRQNGKGRLTFQNGDTIQGYWIDGIKKQTRLSSR